MKFTLTTDQASKLFTEGKAKLGQLGGSVTVVWAREVDPKDGQAVLAKTGVDTYELSGSGPCYDRLLAMAGIIFVPRLLVEGLVGNLALVNAYADPTPGAANGIPTLTIGIHGFGSRPLFVSDDGQLYVELP